MPASASTSSDSSIDGRLRQPHPLGTAAEPVAEVGDAPGDLSLLVVLACQRHDHVIVNLGQCVAVAPAPLLAQAGRPRRSPRWTSGSCSAIQCKSVGPKLKLIQA